MWQFVTWKSRTLIFAKVFRTHCIELSDIQLIKFKFLLHVRHLKQRAEANQLFSSICLTREENRFLMLSAPRQMNYKSHSTSLCGIFNSLVHFTFNEGHAKLTPIFERYIIFDDD
jgi:hypothetical protein